MNIELSNLTVNVIKQSATLVTSHAEVITSNMYTLLFKKYPHLEKLFENAPNNQNVILAEAISAYAMNIDKLHLFLPALEVIAYTHIRARIKAIHYPILGMIFIEALENTLGKKATLEFLDAWREAYKYLANVLINMEKEIYENLALKEVL